MPSPASSRMDGFSLVAVNFAACVLCVLLHGLWSIKNEMILRIFTPHTLREANGIETMWQTKWCQRWHWHSRRQGSMMRMSMMWWSIAVCMTSQIRRFQIASHDGFGWAGWQSQFYSFPMSVLCRLSTDRLQLRSWATGKEKKREKSIETC